MLNGVFTSVALESRTPQGRAARSFGVVDAKREPVDFRLALGQLVFLQFVCVLELMCCTASSIGPKFAS